MLDTNSITALITALRAETSKDSISPESLGSILQKITDLLATAAESNDVAALQSWKKIVTSIKAVATAASIGADDRNSVSVAVTMTSPIDATSQNTTMTIRQATTERAGVMRAQQVSDLNTAKKQSTEALNNYTSLSEKVQEYYTELNKRVNSNTNEIGDNWESMCNMLHGRVSNEKKERTAADTELQSQIESVKVTAEANPFYHIQCDARDNVLKINGAANLVSLGYKPLLFRYTVRQGRNGNKKDKDGNRCRQPIRRGWHLYGNNIIDDIIKVEEDKILFYYELNKPYTTDPEKLFTPLHNIYDDEHNLKKVNLSFGKRAYNVIRHARFRFAIAFAKDPKFNEPFNFDSLVTNLAEFRVHVSAPNGADGEKVKFVYCK